MITGLQNLVHRFNSGSRLQAIVMYYAYVLRSKHDGRLYKGSCGDIAVRVQRHNSGKVISTKPFRPWRLVYCEEFMNRGEAFHREQYWKTVKGAKELALLLGG